MASKKQLGNTWDRIRPVSYWYFLVLFIASLTVSIYALRHNNLTMIELRNDVTKVDKADGDVEGALRDLREFVYSHMNTNLATNNQIKPPIQLKYTYDRLVKAEQNKVAKDNAKVSAQGQAACAKLHPSSARIENITCVQKYVSKHGVKEQPVPDALYKFDFVSPRWSPDVAGLSLVATAIFFALFIIRYGLERSVRTKNKHSF